jgi:hypothetical protein
MPVVSQEEIIAMLNNTCTGLPFFGMGHNLDSIVEVSFRMTWKQLNYLPPLRDLFDCIVIQVVSGRSLQIYLSRQVRGQ